MAGALVSTVQIEIDVEQLPSTVVKICLSASFGLQIAVQASIPECE